MASAKINSIGLFIDGGYFRKINEGLAPTKRVHLVNLFNYIRTCISEHYGLEKESCILTEIHYFEGRYDTESAKKHNAVENNRRFEDTLVENDVVLHYKRIYDLENGEPHEKGVDVWFALETFELSMFRDFDFVVLITGDADHEMLARKIKSLKKQVVLVTWHFGSTNATAKVLKEEVTYHVNINERIVINPKLEEILTQASSYRPIK